jgi:hypothetical protein
MKFRKILPCILMSTSLALTGCQDDTGYKTSKNTIENKVEKEKKEDKNIVQFGHYSLDAGTYDYLMAETSESEEAIKYEELVGFCKAYDSNKDNYLSKKEVDEGFKDLAASVKGF